MDAPKTKRAKRVEMNIESLFFTLQKYKKTEKKNVFLSLDLPHNKAAPNLRKPHLTIMFTELYSKLDAIFTGTHDKDIKLKDICILLEKNIPHYNWVGFYFRNGDKEELKLGPYVGEPTDHTIIPFGKGICGQVAVSNENFVVPDVQAQDNYIACSISVKSEIVVPIFVNGVNIGQIDIDSETIDPFTKEDETFLEYICKEVAKFI